MPQPTLPYPPWIWFWIWIWIYICITPPLQVWRASPAAALLLEQVLPAAPEASLGLALAMHAEFRWAPARGAGLRVSYVLMRFWGFGGLGFR